MLKTFRPKAYRTESLSGYLFLTPVSVFSLAIMQMRSFEWLVEDGWVTVDPRDFEAASDSLFRY